LRATARLLGEALLGFALAVLLFVAILLATRPVEFVYQGF
jgi:hypothetical protein